MAHWATGITWKEASRLNELMRPAGPAVGSQLVTLEEAVEQTLPTTPEAASATEQCWSMEQSRRLFLPSDSPISTRNKNSLTYFISCLAAAAGHSDISAQNCTMQTLYILPITLYSGVFFLKCPHNSCPFTLSWRSHELPLPVLVHSIGALLSFNLIIQEQHKKPPRLLA